MAGCSEPGFGFKEFLNRFHAEIVFSSRRNFPVRGGRSQHPSPIAGNKEHQRGQRQSR